MPSWFMIGSFHYPAAFKGIIVTFHAASVRILIAPTPLMISSLLISVRFHAPNHQRENETYICPVLQCPSFHATQRAVFGILVTNLLLAGFEGSLQPHILKLSSHFLFANSSASHAKDTGFLLPALYETCIFATQPRSWASL